MRTSRILGWSVAVCVIIPLGLWLLGLTGVWYGFNIEREISISVLAALHLFVMYGSVRAIELRFARPVMWTGVIAGAAAMLGWLVLAYEIAPASYGAEEVQSAVFGVLSVWAGFCGLTGLLLISPTPTRASIIARRATITFVALLALDIILIITLNTPAERFRFNFHRRESSRRANCRTFVALRNVKM